jgi:hypothetical protein
MTYGTSCQSSFRALPFTVGFFGRHLLISWDHTGVQLSTKSSAMHSYDFKPSKFLVVKITRNTKRTKCCLYHRIIDYRVLCLPQSCCRTRMWRYRQTPSQYASHATSSHPRPHADSNSASGHGPGSLLLYDVPRDHFTIPLFHGWPVN